MNFKKISATLLTAALVGISGGASATIALTFDPAAGNNDAANKTVYAGQSAFTFTSIQTTLGSMLNINAASGSSIGWQESGHLIFNTYDNGSQRNGNRVYAGNSYDIYGIFTGVGAGDWTGNEFKVNSISSFSINLYASPASGSVITAGTPTSGTQANGGIVAGSKDFLLGTASFAGSFGGTAAQLGTGGNATSQLTANFSFTPASNDYVGVGGFFRAPTPFTLELFASASSNLGQSTYEIDAITGAVRIRTGNRSGATGNITALNVIPEPGAVALVGIALAGLGLSTRRRAATKV